MNLLEKIQQDAAAEISAMNAAADEKIRAIIDSSKQEAESLYAAELVKAETWSAHSRDAVISEMELSLRTQTGAAKEKLFERLCTEILSSAASLSERDYVSYLTQIILQGSENIRETDVTLSLPVSSKELFSKHEDEIINILSHKGITLHAVAYSAHLKGGAVISSPDGKRLYTGTPEGMLRRMSEELRTTLYRELDNGI